ncbi:MAG: AAA family ATPase [Pseudomonadota bacterium]
MAHIRPRLMTAVLAKELKFWPVVCLLGPRQVGKSTLLRELLLGPDQGTYKTLDVAADRLRAESNPEMYIEQVTAWPLVIDEAHKSPAIFDEIKASVDRARRPGKFILSGSVRFSGKVGIRESLTGRAAILRLDTMTLAETTSTKIDLAVVRKYLEKGGMPGVCFLRDPPTIESYWSQWLDTVCERDLYQLGKGRLSSALARMIMEHVALLDVPTVANLAKEIRVDARRITSHIEALKDLFVLRELTPDKHGVGKSILLPFDCGLASFLGSPVRRLWQIWFMNECINKKRFSGVANPRTMRYYLTTRQSFVDFVDEAGFHLFSDQATPGRSELMTMRALRKKIGPKPKLYIHCATNSGKHQVEENMFAVPWSFLVNH